MKLIDTINSRMEKQDPTTFELFQAIIRRPGMYVGSARFDYIDNLSLGYNMANGHDLIPMPDNEMQYWLLHTYSASFHSSSIWAKSLFYRCFGVRDTAFEQYREFLNAELPENPNNIYDEICKYEEKHELVYSDLSDIFEDWESDIPPGHYEKLARFAVETIRGMIISAGFSYEKLKSYIQTESIYTQVRFMFYDSDGWRDDSEIISKPENHELLIALHANVRNTTAEELRKCGCDVFEEQNHKNIETYHDYLSGENIRDRVSFYSRYL